MKLPIATPTEPLYVIAVISNPRRYLTRYDLYRKFAKYVEDSGAVLYTVEASFGGRAFEITSADNPRHIQVNAVDEIWHKENLVNIGLSRLPADWKYVSWLDADVSFCRTDWVPETIQLLQHYDVIQMFSMALDLGPNYEPFSKHPGMFAKWVQEGTPYENYAGLTYNGSREGHPGFGFAATRHAMNTLGGVLDVGIAGAGDRHMALGLIGMGTASLQDGVSDGYKRAVMTWCDRAAKLNGNVGYMETALMHYFHGKKSLRGYHSRWSILVENEFDPYTDVYKDSQGLWRWSGNKPRLRDQMRAYMTSRNEDDISMD